MSIIKVLKNEPDAILPIRATKASAGLDLYAYIKEGSITLKKSEKITLRTAVSVKLPSENSVGLIFMRSGLAFKHGLCLVNGVGVIDSDYTGELLVKIFNNSNEDYCFNHGDRIAQLVVSKFEFCDIVEVCSISSTDRGSNGFGSTGK